MLQSGSTELLTALRFDEAREILEQRAQDLVAIVRQEIADYRAGLQPGSQASGLPWQTYESRAEALRRGAAQRDAARELLRPRHCPAAAAVYPRKRASSWSASCATRRSTAATPPAPRRRSSGPHSSSAA